MMYSYKCTQTTANMCQRNQITEYKTYLKDAWYVLLGGMNDITIKNRTHCKISISEANKIHTMSSQYSGKQRKSC